MLKRIYISIFLLGFATLAIAQPTRVTAYETKIEVAEEAADNNDYAGAIEWFEQAYDESRDKNLKVVIGDLYMRLRDYKRAQRNYERALRRDDEGAFEFVRIDLARAMKYQGNYRDALAEFRTVATTTENDTSRMVAEFEIKGIEAMETFPQNIETVVGFAGKEINSGSGENSPVMTNDGTFYYSSFKRNKVVTFDGSEEDYEAKIYESKINDEGKFEKPSELSTVINRPGFNTSGNSISADGRTMYFTRSILDVNEIKVASIFKSVKGAEGWQGATALESVNSGNWLSLHPYEGELFGEKVLYFVSNMDGGYGGYDIYYSKITGDTYGPPVNLGPKINTDKDEMTPFYTGGTLYYSTNGLPGFGGLDIHFTTWDGSAWSDPANMGYNYNSAQDDFYYRMTSDGTSGYLVSNRPSKSKRKLKGSETCCDDIYAFSIKELVIDLLATVVDENDQPLNEATVELINTDLTSDADAESKTNVSTNEFNFLLSPDNNYRLVVSRSGYYSDTLTTFNTIGILDDYTVKKSIKLNPKPVEPEKPEIDGEETVVVDAYEPIRLNNIYYDFDDDKILDDAEDDLMYLKELMDQYPDMVIELSSHTDSQGPGRYNKALSQRRADSAAKWLIKKGIKSSRIKPVGYGETQILNGCDNGKKCSDSEHRINRRTEFKVLSGPQFITIKKRVTGGLTPASGDGSDSKSGKQSLKQVPVIKFDVPIHHLGKITKGESRDLEYTFTNTGDADLVIEIVTTCKCTDITWPKKPIKPGERGIITATYNTISQKLGPVEKTIDIIANTDPIVVEAKFTAEVIAPEEDNK